MHRDVKGEGRRSLKGEWGGGGREGHAFLGARPHRHDDDAARLSCTAEEADDATSGKPRRSRSSTDLGLEWTHRPTLPTPGAESEKNSRPEIQSFARRQAHDHRIAGGTWNPATRARCALSASGTAGVWHRTLWWAGGADVESRIVKDVI